MSTLLFQLAIWQGQTATFHWYQNYDPTHHWILSTACAATPLVVLLIALAGFRLKAHLSALLALATAMAIAIALFRMPITLAGFSALYGACYGLFPIFWIIFPVIFMYELTVKAGRFNLLQECLVNVSEDSRLQLLLIAFCLGAFFEGVAGFGTPVAVCSTILLGLGFAPVEAACMSLLANTAPVAFGALGIPLVALHGVTGLDLLALSRVAAVLLTAFCVFIPAWVILAYAGFKSTLEIWPAVFITGVTFAVTQLVVAVFHGPWLVDISASVLTIAVLVLFLRIWKPKRILNASREDVTYQQRSSTVGAASSVIRAGMPWIILTAFVTLWGTPQFSQRLDKFTTVQLHVSHLDQAVFRVPPAVPHPTAEPAVFTLNWFTATGTGIFIAALVAAVVMGLRPSDVGQTLWKTVITTRYTAITIAALLGLGFIMRYCGLDATLGFAFARTGKLYPIFGTFIGWLGTATTGSDTSSNVLFGSLQTLVAGQLGISAVIMSAANTVGGVMAKMVAPQSVVVATTATGTYGQEGNILRVMLLHSLALALLMGITVSLFIYCPPLTQLIMR
jgi:lactate permease